MRPMLAPALAQAAGSWLGCSTSHPFRWVMESERGHDAGLVAAEEAV